MSTNLYSASWVLLLFPSLQTMVQPFVIRPVALAQYYEVGCDMHYQRRCVACIPQLQLSQGFA
jgi:hypothetical protein